MKAKRFAAGFPEVSLKRQSSVTTEKKRSEAEEKGKVVLKEKKGASWRKMLAKKERRRGLGKGKGDSYYRIWGKASWGRRATGRSKKLSKKKSLPPRDGDLPCGRVVLEVKPQM